ncbi:MAG: peptidylprolyl isomerase [Xanthomonadaceae bacterium]|nr:peptidylprolyl isomerase [Xanthomonadaceae bacterium]
MSPRIAPKASMLAAALLTGALAAQATAQSTPHNRYRSMQELLDGSKASDWRDLDPARTLYMDLDSGRVVIELAQDFAPAHVANIKAMAKGGYWNGMSINRSQDNFVVQWGDPAGEGEPRKPLPKGAKAKLPAEFTRSNTGMTFAHLPDVDGWAPQVGFSHGFPVGRDTNENAAWLAHCYGMVGAGRENDADSSNGSELYVVTGQSPRQLDRNMSTVGRVVQGIELLSSLPRGTGPLGFYEKPEQRVAIRSIRLAADLKPAERLKLQVLRTDTPLFQELVEARRNRRDDFYKRPAGHIDLCNVPVPSRIEPAPAAKPKR